MWLAVEGGRKVIYFVVDLAQVLVGECLGMGAGAERNEESVPGETAERRL